MTEIILTKIKKNIFYWSPVSFIKVMSMCQGYIAQYPPSQYVAFLLAVNPMQNQFWNSCDSFPRNFDNHAGLQWVLGVVPRVYDSNAFRTSSWPTLFFVFLSSMANVFRIIDSQLIIDKSLQKSSVLEESKIVTDIILTSGRSNGGENRGNLPPPKKLFQKI